MTKVFIDGSAGTTGLRIADRLASRTDLELIRLPEELRKDAAARKDALFAADIAFLCLPDKAAVEAVALAEGSGVKIIDTSTAHRVNPEWAYGFAELSASHRAAIESSNRVANPGCHTGYSGGGKSLIAEYEDENRDPRHRSHRIYGTTLQHKHLPEMTAICGLTQAPVFSPILGDFYEGMATSVLLPGFDARKVYDCIAAHYEGQKLVSVAPLGGDEPLIYASTLEGKDSMRLQVCGHENQTMVTALFDNLGKGASGAAIQNMNILLGVDETTGLNL